MHDALERDLTAEERQMALEGLAAIQSCREALRMIGMEFEQKARDAATLVEHNGPYKELIWVLSPHWIDRWLEALRDRMARIPVLEPREGEG